VSTEPQQQAQLRQELRARSGVRPDAVRVVFAPYRLCPLGAHIDHQLGPVTALAIDRGVTLACAPTTGREVRLSSLEYPGEVRFRLEVPGPPRAGDWGNYPRGAVHALARAGYQLERGMVGVVTGPWSEGGLSSSAALGVACLLALEQLNGLDVTPRQNIFLDQAIENGYLGLRNGILDQSGILLSRRDQLTLVDCATGGHRWIPQPAAAPPMGLLLAFSGLKQALTSTDYNRRVGECAEAARILLKASGRRDEAAGRPALGKVSDAEYEAHRERLPAPFDRRAEHFFGERTRVRTGVEAWQRGDLSEFGRLMSASGESSIRNYECGAPPLIDLYELLVRCSGVYGARFSGAGFRGCCLALVNPAAADEVAREITQDYATRQPTLAPAAHVVSVRSDDGARLLSCVA
jgi:galacturonokinase